jgi:hypothetical protein
MIPLPAEAATDQGLPEDVADAWVTVLLDIWEKDQSAAGQAAAAEQSDPEAPSASRQSGEKSPADNQTDTGALPCPST